MINTDFPMNAVDTLKETLADVLKGYEETIVGRPLRPADANQSLGIFPVDWMPREDSYEISSYGPTLAAYTIRLQLMVKHADEEEGRAQYAIDAKNLRAILYRDASLRLRLSQLSEVAFGYIERVKRFGVRSQRYLNNEIQGTFLFLATTEVWLETEVVPI